MCRERRAVWKARVNLHRRARRLTPLFEDIGLAMLHRLGTDGRLDPAHEAIAEDVGCDARTVRRAIAAFRACGLVIWTTRIVRAGGRAVQTSNAYALTLGEPPIFPAARIGGQRVRETHRYRFSSMQQAAPEVSSVAQQEARAALARVATSRAAAILQPASRANSLKIA
jgi:hypothetical protein